MSIVLAIDTASHQKVAVAVAEDEGPAEAVQADAPQDQAHRLLPLVQLLVGRRVRDVGRVVVVRGPGSFAGLRVGIAVARGLALGTGAAVSGVPTLQAVAEAAGGTAVAVHPIGRREFAVQEFAGGRPLGDARVVASSDIEADPRFAGEGASALGGREVEPRERVVAALRIARRAPVAGPSGPIYLRDPRITPPRKTHYPANSGRS